MDMPTAEDLYQEIKTALAYFDLRWGDRHLMLVFIEDDQLVFQHKGRRVSIDINQLK